MTNYEEELCKKITELQGHISEISISFDKNLQNKESQISELKNKVLQLTHQLKLRIQQNRWIIRENLKEWCKQYNQIIDLETEITKGKHQLNKYKKKARGEYQDLKDLLIGLDDTLAKKNKWVIDLTGELTNVQIQVNNKQGQLTSLITERDNLQLWKDNHICPIPPPHVCPTLPSHTCPVCSHEDYEELKSQISNFPTFLTTREQELVKKIIQKLELDLNNKTSLEEVITKIKELIGKPDIISQEVNNEEVDYLKGLVTQKEAFINSLKDDLTNSKKELSEAQKIRQQALNLNLLLGIILLFSYLFFLITPRKTKRKKRINNE